jgi:hypothetical protein
LEANQLSAAASAFMQIPTNSSKAAGHALNGLHGVAAEYLRAGNLSEARQMVENGRKWIWTSDDSARTDRLLVHIAQRSASVHLESGELEFARASLEPVRALAASSDDMREIERLQGPIQARSKGKYTVRAREQAMKAEGTAIALDCPVAGPLLRVKVDGRETKSDLPDPAAVEVSSSGTGSVELRRGIVRHREPV